MHLVICVEGGWRGGFHNVLHTDCMGHGKIVPFAPGLF